MEKTVVIDGHYISLKVLQVFDKARGYINEHILAVDLSSPGLQYNEETIIKLVEFVKKDFPQLKTVYYDISGDNHNNMYACIIKESKLSQINTGKTGYEKYRLTIADLAPKYN